MYPELWELGLWWGEIPRLALFLTDEITLKDAYWQEYRPEYWPSETKLKIEDYIRQLQDFFHQSNFQQFYTDTLPDNKEFITLLDTLLTELPVQKILDDYIGQKIGITHIILANLLKTSIGVWTGDGANRQVYCFCSRHWLRVGHKNNILKTNLHHTVWHEYLHSVINPLSDQLFPDGITTTEEQSKWYCALNESILWAITQRLCLLNGIVSESDNGWYFDNARRNKAPKTEELYTLLLEYESNRAKYPGIKDFHPILQKEFGSLPV